MEYHVKQNHTPKCETIMIWFITTLLISEHGFVLHKEAFHDAMLGDHGT